MSIPGTTRKPGSSRPFAPAWFIPRVSRLAALSWSGLHLFAAASVAGAGMGWGPTLALLAAIAIHGWVRRPRRCPAFGVLGDGSIRFRDEYGAWLVRRRPRFSRYAVAVALTPVGSGSGRTLAVYRDSLDREQWRRLRALLNSRLVCMGSQKRRVWRLRALNPSNFRQDRGSIGLPARKPTGTARGE